MKEENDDEILAAELLDASLEKTMKKAEAEAARALRLSTELIRKFSKDPPREEANPQDPTAAVKSEEK